jgi:hypothetical protein
MKISGFFTPNVTDIRTTDKEGIGQVRVGAPATSKVYRWVLNSTTTTLTVGGVYTFGTAATGGFWTELYTFGQSAKGTSVNGPVAVAVSAIPAGQYGWVQVAGEVSAQVSGAAGSNAAAFDNLKPVSGQIYLTLDTAAGTAATAAPSGRPTILAAGNSNAANVAMILHGGISH